MNVIRPLWSRHLSWFPGTLFAFGASPATQLLACHPDVGNVSHRGESFKKQTLERRSADFRTEISWALPVCNRQNWYCSVLLTLRFQSLPVFFSVPELFMFKVVLQLFS
jgi:hypothetical protein